MKKLIIILIGLFNIWFIYGQIESRVFPNKDALKPGVGSLPTSGRKQASTLAKQQRQKI